MPAGQFRWYSFKDDYYALVIRIQDKKIHLNSTEQEQTGTIIILLQNITNMKIDFFYERDINKLIEEVQHFNNEDDLWKIKEGITNSVGNLVLHLTGGLNHFIGNALAHNGYVRQRDKEFTEKEVPLETLLGGLHDLKRMVKNTLSKLSKEDLAKEYPLKIGDQVMTVNDTLIFFLAHFNYHLGQINYLRRILKAT